ncbi:VOC family protein [Xanthomonadaceae bacterium JHOS43]|nr:VOC family protein [Xanthomonadaceae bacterium JHOS43]MCX7562724.1 VOC family protein [Xanthomonadaceae bacterium XH05]
MATSIPSRSRLIDHIMLVVHDPVASRNFYEAVLGVLGVPLGGEGDDCFWAEELFVCGTESSVAQGYPGGCQHLAFHADNRELVDIVHAVALMHGGRDNGAPGEHPRHAEHYAAFVLDPDGNHIEVVCHGPNLRRLLASGIGVCDMRGLHSMPTRA